MRGRVKRKAALAALDVAARPAEPQMCTLCDRPLGARVEWHHAVPKSEGGRETVPLHPICHRTVHAALTNSELAALCSDGALDAVRGHPEVARFLRWVADKPRDFHAPTRRSRTRDDGWARRKR